MKFVRDITWKEVFEGWCAREAQNPGWIECAQEKGWPDWEQWRQCTASLINAQNRSWKLFVFDDPVQEISSMLIGPYTGWQSRVENKNSTTFEDLLSSKSQFDYFSTHKGVVSIADGLPFSTEFIGVVRKDINKIVCIDGHHRATATALLLKQGRHVHFDEVKVTIALAELPENECSILDEMLKRGTSKNPQE